ncbi:hypothetical protein C8F04DRAFT_1182660 [Mycena alexandri]|uniref:Uncharacterized protein n=1 Tax=Mycena alexandri TaxID=1745969 RepID=A0AAD6SXM2_9AGAR|nr:hypothetical protein C8F04DRAFT_1182660 [Mycena alexandri]
MVNSEQEYLDLLYPATKKYASWDPEREGTFVREGNIYTDGKVKEYDPVEFGHDSEEQTWVTSENAREVDMSAAVGGFPPVVEPSSMDNTTTTITDPSSALKQLLEDARIRNTVVVSEVHACSSYARLLTTKTDNTVVLDLTVEPAVLGVVSCSATAKWVGHGTSGYFKSQANKKGNHTFYPLFRLVSRSEQSMLTGIGKSHSSID